MDHKLSLTTALTLAYRESTTGEEDAVSVGLIRELLDLIKVSDVNIGSGTDSSSIANVKSTLADMCNQAEMSIYDADDLLTRLKLNLAEDDKWYNAIERSIKSKLDEVGILKSITTLRGKVQAFINQEKIAKILREASTEWNFRYASIENPSNFIQDVQSKLETVQSISNVKDSAIMDEFRSEDPSTLSAIIDKVVDMSNGTSIWKTGWQDFNDMCQGGLREGEMVVCGALPHKDKTGTTLSLFRQIAVYNEPRQRKPNKKPTLIRLTLEDSMVNNLRYLYKNIVGNETGEIVTADGVPKEQLEATIMDTLTSRGFNVVMAYADPSNWSYRGLLNYVLKQESLGCDVQFLSVDYLGMIPTTGCNQGPMGTDVQDMFKRVRNFCRSRGITFLTPHQLSTEAMNLTRGILSDETLLPYIAEKGYWKDAKGLGREFDLGFYVHLIKKDEVTYKAFQRDKHRWDGILPESKKFFIYPFPGPMPIPDDIGRERMGIKKVGRAPTNAPSEMFNF